MKIETANANPVVTLSSIRQQEKEVQSIFSEILEAAGRPGYASASPAESASLTNEGVRDAWEDWFREERLQGRYSSSDRPAELKRGYGDLLTRAITEDAYAQPREFLEGLSKDELAIVQEVHALADPIITHSLTEEGALNLLLPRAAQIDLNQDGLTRTGKAWGLQFPDSNTPANVVEAWDEVTAGMSQRDLMFYGVVMRLPLLTENMVFDQDGNYLHRHEPGDPEFRNPFAEQGFSYQQLAQDRIDGLEFVKHQIPREKYERELEFWTRFQTLLREKGAN